MPKAVIFDLNGVFIQGPRLTDRLHHDYGVPDDEALAALQEVMEKVRLPNAGDVYLHWKPYLDKWDIYLSKDELLTYWFGAEEAISPMENLARELKGKGVKIFILSNNFLERTEYYNRRFPFLREIADKIYYSWQTGFKKDNPEAYKRVLAENNLKPEDCIFFDDTEKNVSIAKSLGITSYLFNGVESVRRIIT